MVTQAKVTPARTSTARAYKPHVRILDAERGLYTVQSERYTYVLYAVDALQGTCECESGQRGFKGVKRLGGICKHLYICRQYHAHRLAYLAARAVTGEVAAVAPAVQSVDWAGLAAEFAALPVSTFDFRSQAAPVPAFIPAPPAFSELFAA